MFIRRRDYSFDDAATSSLVYPASRRKNKKPLARSLRSQSEVLLEERGHLRERAHDERRNHLPAQDVVDRGISSPPKLAVIGGSNGGLMVGNAITRPRASALFGADIAWMSVPKSAQSVSSSMKTVKGTPSMNFCVLYLKASKELTSSPSSSRCATVLVTFERFASLATRSAAWRASAAVSR